MIRIAVDAMGGDFAPREVVHGAVLAAREYGIAVQLVGLVEAVEPELKKHDIRGLQVSIVPASEVIAMGEKPSRAIVKKKNASIVVTTRQVADGLADGMVAAGSTGAASAAAQFGLGRIANVERPAIACSMPTITPRRCICVDFGANVECTPERLWQFAHMGAIVFSAMYNVKEPRVGILNIGTEETKGNQLVQDAYHLLKADKNLNFIGFVEGRDYPMGKVDVVVTDGFTGNVSLKTAEGIAKMVEVILRQEFLGSMQGKVAGILGKPAFEGLKRRVDHNEAGGALLVGVKGVCVIAHGGSKHTAIKNAIRVAKDMVAANMVQRIENSFVTTKAITAGSVK